MREVLAAISEKTKARGRRLFHRFLRDQSGGYLLITGLMMPVLVGFVGLGTDATLWLYRHRAMQSAADAAAYSAAVGYVSSLKTIDGLTSQAKAVTASYGFVDGANRVGVSVKWPYDSRPGSVQVVVQQPQTPLFASMFLKDFNIAASAVAVGTPAVSGTGCVLALNTSASGAITSQGSSSVNLNNCSMGSNSKSSSALTIGGSAQINALSVNVAGGISGSMSHITTTGGVTTGAPAVADPYSGASMCTAGQTPCPPATCNLSDQTFQSAVSLPAAPPPPANPVSFVLCGPTKLNAGAVVTLMPGIYYFEEDSSGKAGSLSVSGGATLQSYDAVNPTYCGQHDCGVTLVFTSRSGINFGGATINGGATIKLRAPTTGSTAGIAFFGDRQMTTGTSFQFNGGSTQIINGAVYLTKAAVTYAGGSSTSDACTQLVADTVTFTGNSSFKIGCSGMKQIGATPSSVHLVQ